jgi:hypothetical protein
MRLRISIGKPNFVLPNLDSVNHCTSKEISIEIKRYLLVQLLTESRFGKTKFGFPIEIRSLMSAGIAYWRGTRPSKEKQEMEDEERKGGDSPLPGVDDEEVPDRPLPGASPGASPARGGEPGDAAMQPGELAGEDECAERAAGEGAGEGAGPAAAEDTSAPSAASPAADAHALGKRRDEAAAPPASGPEAVQKRSRLGDEQKGQTAYEGLVLTAADGTKVCAPRKVAAPKVGRRPRDACTPSAACSKFSLLLVLSAGLCMWQTAEQERGDERLLKQDIFMLERKAAQRREKREAQAAASAADKMVDRASGDAGRMLVDEHRPKSFVQLLSDERTNRTVLGWLKEWDPVVFPKCDRDGKRTLPFRGAL